MKSDNRTIHFCYIPKEIIETFGLNKGDKVLYNIDKENESVALTFEKCITKQELDKENNQRSQETTPQVTQEDTKEDDQQEDLAYLQDRLASIKKRLEELRQHRNHKETDYQRQV